MNFHCLGWIYVIIGTALVGIGGWIATYGWDIWRKSKKKSFFRKGSWDIVRGSMLVALGGLLATYGWNVISSGEQRNNLIRAVAQEWLVNDIELKQHFLKDEVYWTEKGEKAGCFLFPTYRISALNSVLSSGLWNYSNINDNKFLQIIVAYEMHLQTANSMFNSANDSLVRIIGIQNKITFAEKFKKNTLSSRWFENLENRHEDMRKFLISKYKWAIEQMPEKSTQKHSPTSETPPP